MAEKGAMRTTLVPLPFQKERSPSSRYMRSEGGDECRGTCRPVRLHLLQHLQPLEGGGDGAADGAGEGAGGQRLEGVEGGERDAVAGGERGRGGGGGGGGMDDVGAHRTDSRGYGGIGGRYGHGRGRDRSQQRAGEYDTMV